MKIQNRKQRRNCHENKHSSLLAFEPFSKMVLNVWYGRLLCKVGGSNYRRCLFFCVTTHVSVKNSLFIAIEGGLFLLVKMSGKLYWNFVLDLITVAQMFLYSAFFVCERVFLCADKQSSVRFADVRIIRTAHLLFSPKPCVVTQK